MYVFAVALAMAFGYDVGYEGYSKVNGWDKYYWGIGNESKEYGIVVAHKGYKVNIYCDTVLDKQN